jgi:transcriptional regulator with GAF, ATPase, and Fis domain
VAVFSQNSFLLIGESGTGKELISRLIHTLDRRENKKDLVVLDCTTIVPELSGSEFFGHEKGSYTNALQSRDGAFALANNGSLFLDEIGELPMSLQAGLLRVVQEHKYKKVGSNTWHHTDFRLVCATHRNLRQYIEDHKFREDLFFRISDFEFKVPSLKKREEDIPVLARHFLQEFFAGQEVPEIDDTVMEVLMNRDYPGNVRELRQLMRRICLRHVNHKKITPGEIPPDDRKPAGFALPVADGDIYLEVSIKKALLSGASLRDLKNKTMDDAIRAAIDLCNGDKKSAADKLGITLRAMQQFKKRTA